MKKLLALMLALICCFGMTSAALADTFGLGVYTNVESAKSAYVEDGDAYDGSFEVDSTVCALVLDDEGKIVSIRIDVGQTKLGFTAEGAVTTEAGEENIVSKHDKGDAYNMKTYGGSIAEWYEQAKAFEDYCVGKTVEEVLGMALNEKGAPTDADLAAGCTISVNAFLKAVELAAQNAQ